MLPVTISASYAFMLPVATGPNALAFSYGYLKVTDMVRALHPVLSMFADKNALSYVKKFTRL